MAIRVKIRHFVGGSHFSLGEVRYLSVFEWSTVFLLIAVSKVSYFSVFALSSLLYSGHGKTQTVQTTHTVQTVQLCRLCRLSTFFTLISI